jgi:hypothetical protein
MQQLEVDPRQLRRQVEAEFRRHAITYEPPPSGHSVGTPWSKERMDAEVEGMTTLLVEPHLVQYLSGDDLLPSEQRRTGLRPAFVVAEDQGGQRGRARRDHWRASAAWAPNHI